jgi:hypothetical protein
MKKHLHLTWTHLAMFLVGLTVCGTGSLLAAPGDSHWDRQFGLPGTSNRVYALRFNGNTLYASGYGVGTGGLLSTNTGVDAFDGTNWTTALGELTGGSLCIIYEIGFLRGDIYVGGIFTKASGLSAPGLVKWNGSDWVNIGFVGTALAMVSDGTNLYVGGSFTNVGGILNTNIARYDGTNWYSLGNGIGYYDSQNSYVYVLELHNGLLYAGGGFTNAGSLAVSNVAVWNGSSWGSLGTGPANGLNSNIWTLAFLGNDLYVGGTFTTAGGLSANNVAKWDGSSWSALGAGCKGGVNCIGILGSDIYVGGGITNVGGVRASAFAKWDGFSWTTWPITDGVFQYPLNDMPYRMVVKDGSLYIGGRFNQAGDVIANHVVRYDGSNFYPLGTKPANGFATPALNVNCIGQADDGIYVGGLFTAAGPTLVNRIARWDGTNWNDVGGGTMGGTSGGNRVVAIAGLGSDVYVGGIFTNVGGFDVANIAHWDGTYWWNMGYGFDSTVGALAVTPNAVYAGGGFTNVNDPPYFFPVNHIAMWNGYNWYSLGSGVNAGGNVNAIAVSGNNVYVGGSFTNASGVVANRIAMWDGGSWNSLGTGSANGVNGTVLAIAIAGNGTDVYAGGTFTNAGTGVVRGIAHWDGATWSGLGSGATNGASVAEVRALAFGNDGKLYCAGRFTNISGINASSIARWDGTKWEALGSGFFADSGSLRGTGFAVRGNDVFAVGTFTGAGLADAGGIARWNDTMNFTPPLTMRFSRTQLLPGNIFQSRLTCSDITTYAIEYSADFQTWTPLLTNTTRQIDFNNGVPVPPARRVFRAKEIP